MRVCTLKYFLAAVAVFAVVCVEAQNRLRIRGFQEILDRGCSDSMFVRLNLEIADEYLFNDPDTARFFASQAMTRATQTGDSARMAKAANFIGISHYSQGHFLTALENYQRSRNLYLSVGDKAGALKAANNIGIVFTRMGDHKMAIETYEDAYVRNMELGNHDNAAYNLFNMAAGYLDLRNTEQARQTIMMMENLLRLYPEVDIDPSSLKGEIYLAENQPDSALVQFRRAFERSRLQGDEYTMTSLHLSMALANISKENLPEAELQIFLAESMIRKNGFNDLMLDYLKTKADLRNRQGLYSQAYEVQLEYLALKDSMERHNSFNRISELNARYESEKQKSQIALQQKMIQKKSSQFDLVILGGAGLIILVALILVNLARKRHINKLLKEQNSEIRTQRQKILSSIDYARRIQGAILPSRDFLREHFSEQFVYFQPKDIVSGDIYWCRRVEDVLYIAVVDCTGHGVPGAFMSLIAHSALNRSLEDRKLRDPAEILSAVHEEVVRLLHQGEIASENHDGMDVSLCAIEMKSKQIHYCGANNPIYLLSAEGEWNEYKGNSYSIGGTIFTRRHGPDFSPFKTQVIPYREGDELFMFTDGMVDQLGGPDRRKMNKTRFRELLTEIHDSGLHEGESICAQTFKTWKGNTSQTDDILIVGVRL